MDKNEAIKLIQEIEEDGRNVTSEHIEALSYAVSHLEADRWISVKESNKRTPNKWLYHYDNLSQSFYWVCNKCNYKQSWGRFNYCPLCGADMRGEEK